MAVVVADVIEYVGAGADSTSLVEDAVTTALELVTTYVDDAVVPEVTLDRAVLLTAAYIYGQRNAPNGIVNSQFATDAGIVATQLRIARDPLILAYPLLNRHVPQW